MLDRSRFFSYNSGGIKRTRKGFIYEIHLSPYVSYDAIGKAKTPIFGAY